MDNGQKIYSFHNFLFPFIMGESGKEEENIEKIEQIFSCNEYWEYESAKDDFDEEIQNYAMDLYFHPAVRNFIWGTERGIVKNYCIKPEMLQNSAEYIIKKTNERDMEYHLAINKIFLKVCNTGVAILGLECSNQKYESLDDVIKINGYGRRISLPFILQEREQENEDDAPYWTKSICADELEIKLNGKSLKESFKNIIIKTNENRNCSDLKLLKHHICSCITGLLELGNDTDTHFNTIRSQDNHNILIQPALDERMYVMCLVNKSLQELNLVEKKLTSKKKVEDSEQLYEFAFVDEDGCSCQSKDMLRSLMNEHLYDRWIQYGTLYSITAQAFNCICNFEPTIETFRKHYLQMCILILVQHATLISFQNMAMQLSVGLERRGKGIGTRKIADLMDLQERFIAFQNQINFEDVSSQEQAIDIYKMLRKVNHIDELSGAIKEQLDSLYDATNTNQDFTFNKWACILALAALGIDIPTFLYHTGQSFFWNGNDISSSANSQLLSHLIIAAVAGILIAFVASKFSRRRNRKNHK